jgi:hypothetical protein
LPYGGCLSVGDCSSLEQQALVDFPVYQQLELGIPQSEEHVEKLGCANISQRKETYER